MMASLTPFLASLQQQPEKLHVSQRVPGDTLTVFHPPRDISAVETVIRWFFSVPQWVQLGGAILAIVLAISWAAYSVTVAPLMRTYSPYRVSAVVLLVMCIPFLAASSPQIADQDYASLSRLVWVCLLFAIVGPLFLTNLLWFSAIRKIGPSRATLFANFQPFVAAVFAYLILSESLHWVQVIGGVTILLGIVLERRWRRSAIVTAAGGNSGEPVDEQAPLGQREADVDVRLRGTESG